MQTDQPPFAWMILSWKIWHSSLPWAWILRHQRESSSGLLERPRVHRPAIPFNLRCAKNGYGSKPCTPGEHQNSWEMGVHPTNIDNNRFWYTPKWCSPGSKKTMSTTREKGANPSLARARTMGLVSQGMCAWQTLKDHLSNKNVSSKITKPKMKGLPTMAWMGNHLPPLGSFRPAVRKLISSLGFPASTNKPENI